MLWSSCQTSAFHTYNITYGKQAAKCKQRVPNSSRIRIFVETIVSNIFKLERLWLSVLIFERRHKTDQFISVKRSTQLLRILSTLAVVNSVASTELSLASKNHNNSRKVWEKNLVKSWCAKNRRVHKVKYYREKNLNRPLNEGRVISGKPSNKDKGMKTS